MAPKPKRKRSSASARNFKSDEILKALYEEIGTSESEVDDSDADSDFEPETCRKRTFPRDSSSEDSEEDDNNLEEEVNHDRALNNIVRDMAMQEEIAEELIDDPSVELDDEIEVNIALHSPPRSPNADVQGENAVQERGEHETRGWTTYAGRHKTFPFEGQSGIQVDISRDATPDEVFFQIIDNELIDSIVLETNRFAQQLNSAVANNRNLRDKKDMRIRNWTDTNRDEMKKFLGITMWMGLVRVNELTNYWAQNEIYNFTLPRSVMARNRYQLLLSVLHFNNNTTIAGNRLGKIQPLIDALQ